MNTVEPVLSWLLSLLADGTLLYLFSCVAMGQPPCRRSWWVYMAATLAVDAVSTLCFHGAYTGWTLLLSVANIFFVTRFAFLYRKRRLLLRALVLLSLHFILSLLAGGLSVLFLGSEQVNALMLQWTWKRLVLSATHLPLALLLLPAYQCQRWLSRRTIVLPDSLYLLRALLLLTATIVCVSMLLNQLPTIALPSRLHRIILLFGITAVILGICISYLAQDLRFLRMRKRSATLERQKLINDALAEDLRQFRGQVIQMVDALGGMLSEGTPEEKRLRYEEIARQCAQINNENMLVLQRLGDPALAGLLLRKLARCRELGLPIYLHLSGQPYFSRALSPALCQIMGVLVDNALEAAADSVYPRVVIRLSQQEKGIRITTMNTYPAILDVERFLSGSAVSTKSGHTGDGLRSVAALCRQYPNVSVEFAAQGRFILCDLIIL